MPFWLAVSVGSELVRQSEQNQDAGLAGGMAVVQILRMKFLSQYFYASAVNRPSSAEYCRRYSRDAIDPEFVGCGTRFIESKNHVEPPLVL